MLFAASNDFTERQTLFVEVLLPLSLSINYTYRIPFELNDQIAVGKRVVVQFGKHKIYTALVKQITTQPPLKYEAKYIIDVVDKEAIVTPKQLELWQWMATYYLCNEGDVLNAALPSGLKLASETTIKLYNKPNESMLDGREKQIVDLLKRQKSATVDDIVALLGQKTVYPIINALIEKEVVLVVEEMVDKYKPLLKSFVQLHPFYTQAQNLEQLFRQLERAPKQLNLLLAYLQLSKTEKKIAKQVLLEASGSGAATFKALADKHVFIIEKQQVSRLLDDEASFGLNFKLSEAQNIALQQVSLCLQTHNVVLLHGVTASGKTQIYIKLIEEALKKTGQVLFLLPEIALTTQIVERLKRYFGELIGVYHSKFSNNERVEVWNKVINSQYRIVLGARSAVFLPFIKLNLVIVDEEHESSYKQYEPAPRYQARDTAIWLANLHGAKVVLGSATPSIESYYNATNSKYGLVTLDERFGGVQLPAQEVVSIAEETKHKTMLAYFTSALVKEMALAFEQKEQVILFQNRRGYATILICATCGFAPKCINCDVSLTYHKSSGELHCHYCGYHQNSLKTCPACGAVHLMHKGFGTERIEEELGMIFPDIRMARLDLDTARTKSGIQQIIADFQEGKADVLIGTQMVAKGFDFDNVSLIGVINADTLLNYPDFRSFERSYQLLSQVAGRAGRRKKQGKVTIQAYNQEHRILKQVLANDYLAMYHTELAERRQFNYPPFTRLIFIHVKHKEASRLEVGASALANVLKQQLPNMVLGPEQPLIARIRNYYIKHIIIKAEKRLPLQKLKEILKETIKDFNGHKDFKGIITHVDVDPY